MGKLTRRSFLKTGAAVAGVAALGNFTPYAYATPKKSQVFFTEDISVNGLLKIYEQISSALSGKVAIKMHTGEPNGANLLPIELIKALQPKVPNSTIVECNVIYGGPRTTTAGHREVIKSNGFDFCPVDIMDADGDQMLPIPFMKELLAKFPYARMDYPFTPGVHLSEVAVGKNMLNYDSMLVYSHFKGHAMGGFGGALKNIAIGCASSQRGKRQIHGDGWPMGELFLERMVEGGKAITEHFGPRMAYISVLKNISVDCDCNPRGAKPTMKDLGIMASVDIFAIDQASVDMVYAQPADQKKDMVERIETRKGLRQLSYMKTLEMGNNQYELIKI